MMVHPSPYDDHAPSALAIEEWKVVVRGRTSHASAAPELGRNALDGLVLGYTSIGLLRQHFRPFQQVHGIITHGGAAPNIVPDRVEASYYLRAVDADDLEDLRGRVRACLEGAAQASGTTRRDHPGRATSTSRSTRIRRWRRRSRQPALRSAGRTRPDPAGRSRPVRPTSATSASWCRDCTPTWPCTPGRSSTTSIEFAEHCVTEAGNRALLEGAMAMALTGMRVAEDPTLLTTG